MLMIRVCAMYIRIALNLSNDFSILFNRQSSVKFYVTVYLSVTANAGNFPSIL